MSANGDIELMDTKEGITMEHDTLMQSGLNEEVANELIAIFETGKLLLKDLDERALDALKEFSVDGAKQVLKQLSESNLEHVTNKSAYLCGVMKTYRQREKLKERGQTIAKGPNEAKLKEILDGTGYSLDVTTGQRKYGGPPPDWGDRPVPGAGCEVFCGKIPKDVYEDQLIPLFARCGRIWDLRLMMDPLTGANRGYAFITFCERQGASEAVRKLDGHFIQPDRPLKVNISIANTRLFIGNIPKTKGKDEIMTEFSNLVAGIVNVIIYCAPDDKKRNRGFCFLDFESHKAASSAKKRLGNNRTRVWNCDIIVEWADPQEEPDDDTMAKVKVLYVRNLTQEVSEDRLREIFSPYGNIERVKKIKDYGFVHFEEREGAVKAMEDLDGSEMCGSCWEVSLAKPPVDKRKKEQVKREQERRLMEQLQSRGYYDGYGPPRGGGGPGGAMMARGGYGHGPQGMGMPAHGYSDYDYYGGYGDFPFPGMYMETYYDDYYGYGPDYDGYDYGYQAMSMGRSMRGMSRGGGGGGSPGVSGMGGGGLAKRGRGGMPARGGGGGGAHLTITY